MRIRETSCMELDFTKEERKAVSTVADMLTDVMRTMVDSGRTSWKLENCTATDKNVWDAIRILKDMCGYSVLKQHTGWVSPFFYLARR